MELLTTIFDTVGIKPSSNIGLSITGHDPVLPSPFRIGEAGAASLAAVGFMAAELWQMKTGQSQQVSIDVRNAALAQLSHTYFRMLDESTPELWSPLSGFYQTQDERWIQFHCNFPHHKAGVLALLQCADDKDAVISAVRQWQAIDLENQLSALGMCSAMIRTSHEWQNSPQGKAVAQLPLFEVIKISDSAPEALPAGTEPLSGIKVLELTRVIAGPVAGKTLAQLGADVLQIASPNLPLILPLAIDNGFGKRSAHLDLDKPTDTETLTMLCKEADIFLQAYRPGGLAARGFAPTDLAALRPGIICIDLSAYSHSGPWAERHGYDSLVQSATGIAYEQGQGQKPQHLPAQTLDYITGFLAAFGAMVALKRRAETGGSYLVRVSLAQTAQWLQSLGRISDYENCKRPSHEEIKELLVQNQTPFGNIESLLPVLKLSTTPPTHSSKVVPFGTDLPEW